MSGVRNYTYSGTTNRNNDSSFSRNSSAVRNPNGVVGNVANRGGNANRGPIPGNSSIRTSGIRGMFRDASNLSSTSAPTVDIDSFDARSIDADVDPDCLDVDAYTSSGERTNNEREKDEMRGSRKNLGKNIIKKTKKTRSGNKLETNQPSSHKAIPERSVRDSPDKNRRGKLKHKKVVTCAICLEEVTVDFGGIEGESKFKSCSENEGGNNGGNRRFNRGKLKLDLNGKRLPDKPPFYCETVDEVVANYKKANSYYFKGMTLLNRFTDLFENSGPGSPHSGNTTRTLPIANSTKLNTGNDGNDRSRSESTIPSEDEPSNFDSNFSSGFKTKTNTGRVPSPNRKAKGNRSKDNLSSSSSSEINSDVEGVSNYTNTDNCYGDEHVIILGCKHAFHTNELVEWAKRAEQLRCPTCRFLVQGDWLSAVSKNYGQDVLHNPRNVQQRIGGWFRSVLSGGVVQEGRDLVNPALHRPGGGNHRYNTGGGVWRNVDHSEILSLQTLRGGTGTTTIGGSGEGTGGVAGVRIGGNNSDITMNNTSMNSSWEDARFADEDGLQEAMLLASSQVNIDEFIRIANPNPSSTGLNPHAVIISPRDGDVATTPVGETTSTSITNPGLLIRRNPSSGLRNSDETLESDIDPDNSISELSEMDIDSGFRPIRLRSRNNNSIQGDGNNVSNVSNISGGHRNNTHSPTVNNLDPSSTVDIDEFHHIEEREDWIGPVRDAIRRPLVVNRIPPPETRSDDFDHDIRDDDIPIRDYSSSRHDSHYDSHSPIPRNDSRRRPSRRSHSLDPDIDHHSLNHLLEEHDSSLHSIMISPDHCVMVSSGPRCSTRSPENQSSPMNSRSSTIGSGTSSHNSNYRTGHDPINYRTGHAPNNSSRSNSSRPVTHHDISTTTNGIAIDIITSDVESTVDNDILDVEAFTDTSNSSRDIDDIFHRSSSTREFGNVPRETRKLRKTREFSFARENRGENPTNMEFGTVPRGGEYRTVPREGATSTYPSRNSSIKRSNNGTNVIRVGSSSNRNIDNRSVERIHGTSSAVSSETRRVLQINRGSVLETRTGYFV